jgi:ClpP class serine protease
MGIGNMIHLIEKFKEPWLIDPHTLSVMGDLFLEKLNTGTLVSTSGKVSTPAYEVNERTAVMDIEGTLLPRATGIDALCGFNSVFDYAETFQSLQSYENIILRINSPGGQLTGIPEFAELISTSGSNTVAFVDEIATSSAYWLAAACDKLITTPSATLGSVGVYIPIIKKRKNENYQIHYFTAGKQKLYGSPDIELSEEETAYFQKTVEDTYEWFTTAVAKYRNCSVDLIKNTEAGAFKGRNAPKEFYDEIMSFSTLLEAL